MQDSFYLRWFYQVLLDFGSVSLPGVGTYMLNRKNASFIINRTKLQPPSTYLTYLPDYDEAKDFRALLIKSGVMADVSAHAAMAVAHSLHHSNGEGLEAEMIKTWPKQFNKYAGLPIIDVKPNIFAGIKSDLIPEVGQVLTKRTTFNYNYIWLLALLTALAIGVFSYLRNTEENIIKSPSEVIITTDTTIIYNEDTMVVIDQSTIEDQKSDTSKTVQTDVKPPVKVAMGKDITKPTDINPDPAHKADECVVIVGAFGHTDNAAKMVKKLEKLGYKTYSSSAEKLTRVGLYFDCKMSNQDQFKTKIRKQIAQDAWFLHDTIANN